MNFFTKGFQAIIACVACEEKKAKTNDLFTLNVI